MVTAEAAPDEVRILLQGLLESHPTRLDYAAEYFECIRDSELAVELKLAEYEQLYRRLVQMQTRTSSWQKSKILQIAALKKALQEQQDLLRRQQAERRESALSSLQAGNKEILKYLQERLVELERVEDKDAFDRLLDEVKKAEQKLVVSGLDGDDELIYDRLIDEYAAKISSLTAFFANADLREYNREALADFKAVIDDFKKNRRRYRRRTEKLSELLKGRFFIYDPNKLYREVAEFYAFTYNYIFNRLDNEDKYRLAQLALEVRKK